MSYGDDDDDDGLGGCIGVIFVFVCLICLVVTCNKAGSNKRKIKDLEQKVEQLEKETLK